ncbi:MAG: hypothetical protein LBK75_06540 [Oscillospiraceae bacterium]|jgi:hypothetical protein|nr:hypothetical protein [Oscillospiraceae bacterium]
MPKIRTSIFFDRRPDLFVNAVKWLKTVKKYAYDRLMPNATNAERLAYYPMATAQATEFWRASRFYAGIQQFCGLGYSKPGQSGATSDVLSPDLTVPVIRPGVKQWFTSAFAPLGIIIEQYGDTIRLEWGESKPISVSLINDLNEDIVDLPVTLAVYGDDGDVLYSETKQYSVREAGSANQSDVNRDVFHLRLTSPGLENGDSLRLVASYERGGVTVTSVRTLVMSSSSKSGFFAATDEALITGDSAKTVSVGTLLENYQEKEQQCVITLAIYDADGRLAVIDSKILNLEIHESERLTNAIAGIVLQKGYTASVYIWDNGYVPLAAAQGLPLSQREETIYSAANAEFGGGVRLTTNTASPSGYELGYIDQASSFFQWKNVIGGKPGDKYLLKLYYATNNNPGSYKVLVNGENAGSVSFNKTGGWSNYSGIAELELVLTLNSDNTNVIRFERVASEANVAQISLAAITEY